MLDCQTNVTPLEPATFLDRLSAECLVGKAAAAARVGTHPATVTRWINKGTKTATGQRVRLEAVRLTGRLMTSHPAVARFLAALRPEGEPAGPPTRTPAQRNRAADVAENRLRELGVL